MSQAYFEAFSRYVRSTKAAAIRGHGVRRHCVYNGFYSNSRTSYINSNSRSILDCSKISINYKPNARKPRKFEDQNRNLIEIKRETAKDTLRIRMFSARISIIRIYETVYELEINYKRRSTHALVFSKNIRTPEDKSFMIGLREFSEQSETDE